MEARASDQAGAPTPVNFVEACTFAVIGECKGSSQLRS